MVSAAILAVAFGTIVASPPAAGQEAAFFSGDEDLVLRLERANGTTVVRISIAPR
jgi:hypothetical protein